MRCIFLKINVGSWIGFYDGSSKIYFSEQMSTYIVGEKGAQVRKTALKNVVDKKI